MSITLLCLVKGNTTASAFPVDINKDQLVGHLKEAIKAKNPQTFANVDAKDIKLWKVPISDDQVDPLSNLSLQDSDELLAINEIGEYWTEKPPKKRIHVIVEPPESTATSDEVLKLREQLASMQALLNKSVYDFDVVVSPKRTKGFKWTVNIEDATLEGLKEYIQKMEKPPALENDSMVLKLISDGKDIHLGTLERSRPLQSAPYQRRISSLLIGTPSKPFTEWNFPKVCELYELSDDPNPDIDVYSVFHVIQLT